MVVLRALHCRAEPLFERDSWPCNISDHMVIPLLQSLDDHEV